MAKIISFAEKGKKAEPEAKVIALDLAIKEASKAIIRIKESQKEYGLLLLFFRLL